MIAATPAKWADDAFDGPSDWAYGQVARARGDKQKALVAFAAARKRLDAQWQIRFKDQRYFALGLFARLDAGLGRKEDAIREALQAVDLLPIAKDSYWGPGNVTNLALVYAWTGERDRALEQLEIVAKIPAGPAGPTYGDLKLQSVLGFFARRSSLRKNRRLARAERHEIVRILLWPAEQSGVRLEIGHVLFIDIVGYSKLLITEQSELLRKLTALVARNGAVQNCRR